MQARTLTPNRLRRLAETEIPSGRVLSLYLNLDPSEFAVAPARQSAVRSLLDEAAARVREAEDELDHDEKVALRSDLERAEALLTGDLPAEGAHGLAVLACAPAGLWEVIPLPEPVESAVHVDRVPRLEPVARVGTSDRWAVLLVPRAHGRVLRGTAQHLQEVAERSDDVHGQHSQGGWSQARYERSVDQQAAEHVAGVVEVLHRSFRRRPFDALLIATPDETWGVVQDQLPPEIASRLAGRVSVDVEVASPDDVLEAARPEMERAERERERELLDRLAEGLGTGGRAAAGLPDVLGALVEQRVEALLLAGGFAAEGVVCDACGWMGADPEARTCPVDGEALSPSRDVVEVAMASAVGQSADVAFVEHHDDLERHGGVAALLRFRARGVSPRGAGARARAARICQSSEPSRFVRCSLGDASMRLDPRGVEERRGRARSGRAAPRGPARAPAPRGARARERGSSPSGGR